MSDPSEHTISTYSRKGLPQEEAELVEFVDAVTKADLQMFVDEAMYDSNSNCCYFKFRYGLTEAEDVAEQLLAIATATLSQFEWFGIIHHGRGPSEMNPWFGEKTRQVSSPSLTAFGIHLESRYGKASELADMLKFAQRLALVGLESLVERVECDSKAAIFSFDFNPAFSEEDPRAPQMLDIALGTLSHFDWFGVDRFGLDLLDRE